jgi:DNA-binding transcriptional LysR family regulator
VNLRQLQYFLTIADEQSFSRAAERLRVAQPSVSQQIKRLEQELGGPLLERLPTGVRLTAAGRAFLSEARASVAHAERATRDARRALDLEAGEIEVATVTSAAAGILPTVLRRWQELHPSIEVSLSEYLHRRLLDDGVRNGDADMAIGSPPASWEGPIEQLGWEEFVLVFPTGDPALRKRSVNLTELAERRWVQFASGHGLAEVLELRCAAVGFTPHIALRTSQVTAAPQFAAAGIGPVLVPDHVVPDGVKELVRPVKPRVIRPVVAFTRRDWSPITSAFLDILREYPWRRKPPAATNIG